MSSLRAARPNRSRDPENLDRRISGDDSQGRKR
jgi:hypothetical protein